MRPETIILIIAVYFLILMVIAHYTSRKADTKTFFTANRQSPWYLVAFGMIGASLSGVTFISVPGWVEASQFSYMQMVLGYLLGYFVIATVLMPMYYRLNLVSIYTYLEKRFGFWSYKTGAFFFLLSRVIGAAFRLFLVALVLQLAIFDAWGVPFWVSVMITILLIWVYTFKGGIKTIVWTDTLQTFFMLSAVIITIYMVSKELNLTTTGMVTEIWNSKYSTMFFWDDLGDGKHFLKQFFSGAFIAIVMTGLDQDMMQKNLTCRNIGEAQKNMFWFSIVLVFVNILFLSLGALLYLFAAQKGIELPARADYLYPTLALDHFNSVVAILFVLGLTAAAYSSADSALTALTTSFCVDFLDFDQMEESKKKRIRMRVHVMFSIILFITILIFRVINDESVISEVFQAAGLTYGPLLGMYFIGLFTKVRIKDRYIWIVAVAAPLLSYLLKVIYGIGFEILIINGALTALGMLIIGDWKSQSSSSTEGSQ